MLRFIAWLGLVGSLIAAVTIAKIHRDPGSIVVDWRVVKEPPIEVRVESPSRGRIARKITAPGVVEPVEEVKIGSQMLGRVVAVNVKEGDVVKASDVLVKLDDTDSNARLLSSQARFDRLRAAITQAEDDLAKANRDEAQHGRLAGRGYSTPTELADARTHVHKAEAALQMSRRELLESEALKTISLEEVKRTEIRAPIDGVVAGLSVRVGEVVIAGTMNLPGTIMMTITDPTRMRVSADVEESDIPLVQPGQASHVYLQSDGRTAFEGVVEKITAKGRKSGESVGFETQVRVDHPPPSLRAGMSATVEIEVSRTADALGVPSHAVVHRRRKDLPNTPAVRAWAERNTRSPGERARDAESRYVKVAFVVEGGVARARPVELGLTDEFRVEILAGVTAGEQVVVAPFRALDQLTDGQSVHVVSDAEDSL
ncbi:efflux RND transporter periplasmic adaptor subunit [Paludisphaera borealis]|uniref:Macrolide export protein MacA n=1 Tax=Paludisphaera borealis TaxID=1387353 RepID=A0A1U7CTS7_9BACT|nr:efflux RND transporter periplasmic adaptor subunit [Paludisphaera borealis]APW62344.1 Macrolide export protein MacA [Paludisphaera borealis]